VPHPAPVPLPENTGLAFLGERGWPTAQLGVPQAQAMLEAGNHAGRTNREVIRGYVGVVSGRSRERWQIDFPPHFTEQEAALYEDPFALLRSRCPAGGEGWWRNPHANPALRSALARLDRYLVTPLPAPLADSIPAWAWVDDDKLPDETLLALARDDDFTHGILQSREFSLWWQEVISLQSPTLVFESFPFPWAPRTPLGALTAMQQELRYDVTKAVRTENAEQLTRAVSLAYGWSASLDDVDLLKRLQALYQRRATGR